ncbi:hypothetical protein BY996DRAFT_7438775 [Phakopsora pachyrhizi]|nr:hypothetical protein BY996DRAFT_7895135 [Phakopsora pachyrhizi]KAI8449842.1 hypothetical protein BY996DRAFT_7438775 [Phakopsora pachyrhizi]
MTILHLNFLLILTSDPSYMTSTTPSVERPFNLQTPRTEWREMLLLRLLERQGEAVLPLQISKLFKRRRRS